MSGVTTRDELARAVYETDPTLDPKWHLLSETARDTYRRRADALLASGAIIDAATLDDDAELVRDVSARWGAEATYVAHNVQHVLRHLSAALSERTS